MTQLIIPLTFEFKPPVTRIERVVVTIVFLALGFMLPASIGMPLTGMILLYLFPGIVVGYVAKCLWRTIEGASN
jgi:uncharacterized membrane protein YczE